MNLFHRFVRDETGATAIEYALIAALMAVVVVAGINFVGTPLKATFQKIGACLANTTTCTSLK